MSDHLVFVTLNNKLTEIESRCGNLMDAAEKLGDTLERLKKSIEGFKKDIESYAKPKEEGSM
jgi:DNA anti-recombination protein RmuC